MEKLQTLYDMEAPLVGEGGCEALCLCAELHVLAEGAVKSRQVHAWFLRKRYPLTGGEAVDEPTNQQTDSVDGKCCLGSPGQSRSQHVPMLTKQSLLIVAVKVSKYFLGNGRVEGVFAISSALKGRIDVIMVFFADRCYRMSP